MRKNWALAAFPLVFMYSLLLQAATEPKLVCTEGVLDKAGKACIPDCSKDTKPSAACVFTPDSVIERITPTLPLATAALAVSPRLPLPSEPAPKVTLETVPNVTIAASFLASSHDAIDSICKANRAMLPGVTQSTRVFTMRMVINQRCQEAPNSSRLHKAASVTESMGAATDSVSNPTGAPLSLEQNILVGVTDFIVSRAQQELVDYVVQDFSTKLCDTEAQFALNPSITMDMTQIFPRACEVLSESKTPDLRQIGSAFEQALKQDLRDFPKVFLNAGIASGVFCKSSPASCKEAAQIALAVYKALEASRNGGNPILSIATAARGLDGCSKGNRICGVQFLGDVLDEFAAQYENLKAIDPQNADEVAALVDLISVDVLKVVGQEADLQDFVKDVNKFHQTVQALVGPVHQIAADVSALQGSSILTKQQKVDLSLDIVENLNNVWSIGLPDVASADRAKLVKIAQEITNAWAAGEQGTYDSLIADLFSLAKDLNINFPIPASVQQYLPLITALATAQKPEDVTAALEKFALPVGSWRDKKNGQHLLNLNAFAGAIAGPTDATGGSGKAYRFAVFAPVGLDYNLNRHWGVLLSMVDLGNLAEIRFHQDNGDTEVPEAHLRDVVSPGLWFRYSIHNTPLATGFGASLRRQTGSAQTTNGTFWQAGIFLAVDVPLFTLYKGRKN